MSEVPGEFTTATLAPAAAATVGSSAEAVAFIVGWRLAELYNREELPPPTTADQDAPVPPHLPGASEMTDHEKAMVNVEQAEAALRRLSGLLDVELPRLDAVEQVLKRDAHSRDDVRREVRLAFVAIRNRIAGRSPRAAMSCGLGRMLADTTLLPHVAEPKILMERFDPHRLANGYRWLDDLSTSFPPHAAGAVKASLRTWETWVARLERHGDTLQAGA